MPVYTFSCVCGWEGDQRTTFDTNNVRCPSCESTAKKESVYRLNFGGFARTPKGERDFSVEFKNSQEAGAELEYRVERLKDATQIADLQPPPLYQMAKAKASELRRKGATADDLS
jgi:hypothetical protein